ncbi:DUF86 domain-containing protein [Candidatus Woesearchaeota archaeon]|nr:DUF86 domain-containing protein [Candidatus Woesearchaeota archaeon]
MNEKDLIFLKHILESIEKIESYTKNSSKEKFTKQIQLQDAIIRRLEIMGEAAKNITSDFKNKHNSLPWSEMIRTRDKVIHGYFGIDLDIVWDITQKDLPLLKKQIKKVLSEKD